VRDNGDLPTKPSDDFLLQILCYPAEINPTWTCWIPNVVFSHTWSDRTVKENRTGYTHKRWFPRQLPAAAFILSASTARSIINLSPKSLSFWFFFAPLHPPSDRRRKRPPRLSCIATTAPHFARPPQQQQPRAIRAGPFINLTKEYRRPVVAESTSICLLLNLYMYQAKHSSHTMYVMSNVYVRTFFSCTRTRTRGGFCICAGP